MSSAVVIGASSGVGRALVRALARDGRKLVILSRDARDLQAIASDVRVRFGAECWPVVEDITRPDWDVEVFARECQARLGVVDALLIPAGGVTAADVGPNADVVRSVHDTNYIGPARLAAAFGNLMAGQGRGWIVVFSSIAAAAPRSKNAAYSAAKAALETYARALRHALAPSGVEVLVLALGYVDTPQSFGHDLVFPVASPEAVADYLARHLGGRASGGMAYYPRFWRWVTCGLRLTPWVLYRRLRF